MPRPQWLKTTASTTPAVGEGSSGINGTERQKGRGGLHPSAKMNPPSQSRQSVSPEFIRFDPIGIGIKKRNSSQRHLLSIGLLSRGSQVRVLPRLPKIFRIKRPSTRSNNRG